MAPRGNRASRISAGVRSSCRSSSTTCDGRRGLRAAAVERSHGLVAPGAGTGAFGVVGAALRGAWRPGPGDLRGRFHPFAHRLSGAGRSTSINRLRHRRGSASCGDRPGGRGSPGGRGNNRIRRIVPAARPWFASIRLCSSDASPGDVMSNAPLSEFLVLSRGRWDEELSEDEIQAAIDDFYDWHGRLVAEGKVRVGQRLKRDTRRVSRDAVTAGPSSASKEVIGGYWPVLAATLDAAGAIKAHRTEKRRDGKECDRTSGSRWWHHD